MKAKTMIRVALLGFVALSVGWLLLQPGKDKNSEGEPAALSQKEKTSSSGLPNRVIVYYFHTSYRCPTCYRIENFTREAVETAFAQALQDGRLVFQALNVEEAPNAHFIQDYQLHTKSVIVVEIKDNQQARWKNLTQIWQLVWDKENFLQYIQNEVNLYLQGK